MYSYLRPILAVVLTLVALLSLGWFLLHQGMEMENRWLLVSVGVCLFVGLALVGVNIELSRRTSVERNLADQRKLLESILNGCPDAVVVADPTGKIIFRNPAALNMIPILEREHQSGTNPARIGILQTGRCDAVRIRGAGAAPHAARRDGQGPGNLRAAAGQDRTCVASRSRQSTGERRRREDWRGGFPARHHRSQGERAAGSGRPCWIGNRSRGEDRELTRLADLLQSCQTLQEACKISESILPAIFQGQPGALFLINSSRNLLEAGAVWNGCSITEQIFDPDDCWALRLGKLYGGSEPASPVRCSHLAPVWTGNYVCVPLVAQGETLGVLYVEESDDPAPSLAPVAPAADHERLQRRATAVGERLSLALSNLKLREVLRNQSIRDPLTGLFNRRYLEESLVREVNRAARKNRSVGVVMLDLDLYKNFNDTFGHQAGDMLLQEVAGVLKSRVRAGDLVCRFGGEEFALILSEVDAQGAGRCVDVIRQEIKHLPLQHRGQALRSVTISAGIAIFPDHGGNPEDLIRAADAALYQAKRAGRDRMVLCGEEVSSPRIPAKT